MSYLTPTIFRCREPSCKGKFTRTNSSGCLDPELIVCIGSYKRMCGHWMNKTGTEPFTTGEETILLLTQVLQGCIGCITGHSHIPIHIFHSTNNTFINNIWQLPFSSFSSLWVWEQHIVDSVWFNDAIWIHRRIPANSHGSGGTICIQHWWRLGHLSSSYGRIREKMGRLTGLVS